MRHHVGFYTPAESFFIISSRLLFHIASLQFQRYKSLQAFSTFIFFCLCISPLARLFFTSHNPTLCYAGVNCACSSFSRRLFFPLSVWEKSTLLLSSKTDSKVNQFSSTTSLITEPGLVDHKLFLREPLCGQQCCVTHKIAILICRVPLLIWNLNPA